MNLTNYIQMYKEPKHWYEKKEAEQMKQRFKQFLIIKDEKGYIHNRLISLPLTEFAVYLGYNINLEKQKIALIQERLNENDDINKF